MKCPTCGGRCKFEYGKGYVCASCGNIYDSAGTSESAADKLNIANQKRIEDYDFDGALALCRDVLAEDPNSLEANWCAMLAEYKIIYLKNDENKYVPTFLDPDVEIPLYKCEYYQKLNSTYRDMADKIEQMRRLVVDEARDIPDYDVFISYKQHKAKNSNAETEESEWAEELYRLLSKQTGDDKLRVFYDKESLDESNAGWEPHIYAALKSAKFLVLMGSSVENINSTWVKNEWKRFIAYRNMGREKTIAVLAKNIDPLKLPDVALRAGQMIRADERGWQEKLIKRANDACKENKDVDYLINEAETFICKNKFGKAKQNFLKVCSLAPRDSRGYWGLLRCKLKAFDDYDIIKSKKKLVKINEFNEAMRYASGSEKPHYEAVRNAQLTHNTIGYERVNYNEWRRKSKASRFFKRLGVLVAVAAVLAFGVYSVLGITNPLTYSDTNGVTLVGKSIYFNFVVKDLEVDLHDGSPVTEIGDGALAGSKIRTLTLGETVERIGEGAFKGCTELTEVHILNSDIEIAAEAFAGCTSLVTVTVGGGSKASVKRAASGMSIGDNAFAGCTLLENVTFETCAIIGANAFDGCVKLKKLKIDISDERAVDTHAFDGMGKGVEISLPTVAESVVSALSERYADITFSTFTRDKVEECIYFINKLESVSGDSASAIEKAEALYAALDSAEKQNVSNYGILQNAKVARAVAEAINAIGTVTLDSEAAISNALNLYNNLTAEQKKAVANYETLTTAKAVYDVMKDIDGIGDVTSVSEPLIEVAENAYLALTYEQRDMVLNYSVLTEARAQVDKILANIVTERINSIDSKLNKDSGTLITTVETMYDALTEQQKTLVNNYRMLTDARAAYNVVKTIGDINLTANSEEEIKNAEDMYNALNGTQKNAVGNYNDLLNIKAAYPVVVSIDSIGSVMENSMSAITAAESAYAQLSDAQKAFVTNYSVLTDSRAVFDTVSLIAKIDKISENVLAVFEEAKDAYNALTASQKSIVGNYGRLANAIKAHEVFELIEAIGNVTKASLSNIEKAESAYGYLTSAQKEMVSNYTTMTGARNKIDELIAGDVITLINALPTNITLNSKAAIEGAREAYNNLSTNQRRFVTNLSKLSSAENIFAKTTVSFKHAGPWTVHDGYSSGYNLNGSGYINNNYQIRVDISNLDLSYIKNTGKNIKITMELTVWEVDDGYQELYIYNSGVTASSAQKGTVKPIAGMEFEHDPGKKNSSQITYVFTAVISPDAIAMKELWIAFDANGEGDDDWKCKNLVFNIETTTDSTAKMKYAKK